jgi:hypothetical protein
MSRFQWLLMSFCVVMLAAILGSFPIHAVVGESSLRGTVRYNE